MKKLESNSMSEAFGINSLEIDELYTINGGATITTGNCIDLGPIGPNTLTLSGAHPTPDPRDDSHSDSGPTGGSIPSKGPFGGSSSTGRK